MFTFSADVPANLYAFLITLLQPWINRRDHPLFRIETTRYGLVSFVRKPWPITPDMLVLGDIPSVVSPAGEQDIAALNDYSRVFDQQDPTGELHGHF